MTQAIRRTLNTLSPTGILAVVVMIAALTMALLAIGEDRVGAGAIPLLFLLPIGWSTARWGQGVGIVAAVLAAGLFDFFFIPPYYTFTIGSLEGWLVFAIFLLVAIVIVGRIQSGLSQARQREKEALFMYELSSALAGQLSAEAVARVLADRLQQLFLAARVEVKVSAQDERAGLSLIEPEDAPANPAASPDLDIPLVATREVEGEIRIWKGKLPLPAANSRLLEAYSKQGALALERTRLLASRFAIG